MHRRTAIKGLAAAGTGWWLGGLPTASRAAPAAGPRVVIVRFGGGVRRRETIDPDGPGWAPHLLHRLIPRGTLWEDVVIDGYTTHSVGTISITTGRYHWPESIIYLDDRLTPPYPTLFELARRQLHLRATDVLYVNNGSFTEWLGWSDDPAYGFDVRPGLLSVRELTRAHLERRLEDDSDGNAIGRHRAELERLDLECYRTLPRGLADDADLQAFWAQATPILGRRWFARGTDRLCLELTQLALELLAPRLLMVNFLDVDYAHWGLTHLYRQGVRDTDFYTWQIWETIQALPAMRDDTYLVVVPDCGRGSSSRAVMPFQHHEPSDAGSEQIWALVLGPDVPRGERVTRRCAQVDVAPTVARLLGLEWSGFEGSLLDELYG